MNKLPVIDMSDFISGKADADEIAVQIGSACRIHGFFYISGHGVDMGLQDRLHTLSREFFALPEAEKMKVRMELGGRAWRGYFPVGGELTSGRPDIKEGLYFGQELMEDDAKVRRGLPMHGRNLFPPTPPGLKETVLEYMDEMTRLGHLLMKAFSMSLDLDPYELRDRFTSDPLTLFRIFHYPPQAPALQDEWGVGEHTDYGVLTILKQDSVGGLQVWSGGRWIDAPPIEDTFVCNIGDMLEKMTGGLFRSTPHRVRNTSGRNRFSFPFFFDPGWDVRITPIRMGESEDAPAARKRWDGADLQAFDGTYGEYILGKVARVFPDLVK